GGFRGRVGGRAGWFPPAPGSGATLAGRDRRANGAGAHARSAGASRRATVDRGGTARMRSFLTRVLQIAERPRLVPALAMRLLAAIGLALAVRDGPRMKSLDESAFLDLSGNLAFHREFAHTNRPDIEGFDPTPPGSAESLAGPGAGGV